MAKSTLTENRYAVCIGINTYEPSVGLGSLHHAEDDALAIDALLVRLGFPDGNRKLLLGKAATLNAINVALEEFVLFYFAGHSKPLKFSDASEVTEEGAKGEVFLASYDFDANKIRQSRAFRSQHALGMKRLREIFFEGEGSRKRLFIFDSCYSGDFFGPRYREEVDPVQGYIGNMLDSRSTGRLALSSCLPYQKALDADTTTPGHSPFTYYLLKALSGEDPDALDRHGCLTVSDLFKYIEHKLPEDQCPVLSGVQQGSLKLICYSQPTQALELEQEDEQTQQDRRRVERDKRLRAMFTDHSGFMQDRLASFVGREKELMEVRQRINELLPTGGYLTITGQAGQGKSSIIAKIVEDTARESGSFESIAFHFIPLTPPPDYQVALLRNLMSHLILKYNLSDLFLASESRAALSEGFPRVLKEVAEKGGQEVIFIDGLDQLQADQQSGLRDLSFLPQGPGNPPKGTVFVLGTRPNDTLRPLELLKPYHEYKLPNLSRLDFDLIIQHRGVSLESVLADSFYEVLNKNALYLDLVAKELAERKNITKQEVEEIVRQIAEDPENLFSLTIDRLHQQGIL